MKEPTVVEMIESIIDRFGENQAFAILDIDRKSYYNYKNGGNTNAKVARKIRDKYTEVSRETLVNEGKVQYGNGRQSKSPGEVPGQELVNALKEINRLQGKIIAMKEQEQSELLQRVRKLEEEIHEALSTLKGFADHQGSKKSSGAVEARVRTKHL